MKQIFLIMIFLWMTNSIGQSLKNGIYKGQELPFTICYFTKIDSIIEVEYFYQKSGQIFGHITAKNVEIVNSETKPMYKSIDDSIKVFIKKDYLLIKRKGTNGIKVYNSLETKQTIITMRNKNSLFTFSQNLLEENKTKSNFNQQEFWDKLNSYQLEKFITLDAEKFKDKLNKTRSEF